MDQRHLQRKLLALLIFTAFATACADPEKSGGIVGGEPPDLLTDVTSLVFVEVALGETDVQTLTVMNVGKGPLKIDSVELVETTTEDSGNEFAKGANWINAAELATDEELSITVSYAPGDKQPDKGFVELKTNDPKFEDGIVRIPLETPSIAPRIFSRDNVIFRRVPPITESTRNKFWQLTEVQNIGSAPLDVNDIIVTPDNGEFSISFPSSMDTDADPADDADALPEGVLEAGASAPIRVFFNPVDDLPATADLIFYSNDPVSSEYVVNLTGNSGSPCLQLSEETELNFGEGAIGYANNKTVVLENCSPTSDLTISEVDVCTFTDDTNCDASVPTFGIRDGSLPAELPDNPAVLGPAETAAFVLTYTPENLDVSKGQLTVLSDDPAKSQLVVPIVGKGTDNQCPQAVAEASLADATRWQTEVNTIPLKTVNFRATNSVDPDGSVDSYEWNVIQRPQGSTAQIAPSAQAPTPSLFLDLAGEYVIELKVFDDRGTENCGDQALITINAIPDEKVHVQLVWDTPGDSDQTDIFGTDLDLHFLHPNGDWNRGPWDIYWSNNTANWGDPGTDDDPSLDIDDVDGAGPENINLNGPQDGISYEVGVFYFSDEGYGPSYATVRIFLNGTPAYEKEELLSRTGRFWHVGTITWPAATVTPTNTLRNDFP